MMSLYRYLKERGKTTNTIDMFTETIIFDNNKLVRVRKTPGITNDEFILMDLYHNNKRIASFVEYSKDSVTNVKINWLLYDKHVDGDFGISWYRIKHNQTNDKNGLYYVTDYKGDAYVVTSIDTVSELF